MISLTALIKQLNITADNASVSDYIFHVAKFLVLVNQIREKIEYDSIIYDYCKKMFFGNQAFENPLTKVRASSRLIESKAILLQQLIDDELLQSNFLSWLDQIDLNSEEVQLIAKGAKTLPKNIDWEQTVFGGGEKYIHLYYKDSYADINQYSCAERQLVKILYTAFILIEYNRRQHGNDS